MTAVPRRTRIVAMLCIAAALATTSSLLAGSARADMPGNPTRDQLQEQGIAIDASFEFSSQAAVVGATNERASVNVACPDRGAVALSFWQTSGQGCAVIGTTASTKVYFGWYLHHGPATSVSVLARGFNAKAVPTYYECGTATTGRTKAIPWGKVASAKYIKMISNHVGGGKIQWS